MKDPPHPGDFIRTEIIEPAGLSVTAAATALRVAYDIAQTRKREKEIRAQPIKHAADVAD